MNNFKLISLGFFVAGLSSCASWYGENTAVRPYSNDPVTGQAVYYPETRVGGTVVGGGVPGNNPVAVPNTYHVGSAHSPAPHKSRDKNWVNSQNPMGYTIEIADEENPASVAGKLHQTPKTDRVAEVKYEKNGKTHYKGIYGTYSSYEAAQKALNDLPPDVKAGAQIKNWSSVQGGVNR